MPKLELTLETVTPLFLAGADARGTPELRPPAFRGAMRYWLRAALGGVIGDNNLKALHALESAVMGNTDFGSPIQLQLRGDLKFSDQKILLHKDGRQAGQRKAFSIRQSFKLTMRQLRSNDEAIWQAACSALNLALLFGGVGLRSRRGFGTLRIANSSDATLVKPMPQKVTEWKKYIEDVTTQAITAAQRLAQSNNIKIVGLPSSPTRYPCVSRGSLIRIAETTDQSAIDTITELMRKMPQDQRLGGINPRQASPLWVRPIETEKGYSLLFVVLPSQLKGRTDYTFVRRFLDEKFKGQDVSVKGWNV